MAALRSLTVEPPFMQEAEIVREWRDLEREQRRLEDDDARARMERDAYYPADTESRSQPSSASRGSR